MIELAERFQEIRNHTEKITAPLSTEDYVVQPIVDVSPPKWHLGHTTWFFETLVLKTHQKGYQVFDPQFNYLFNSYYESIGARTLRTDRGNLTRPSVAKIMEYRSYVNNQMMAFFKELEKENQWSEELKNIVELGLQHEQQHQELLLTDIKYILGKNPLFPIYQKSAAIIQENLPEQDENYVKIEEGIYEIGYTGNDFCFDNELGTHKVYLEPFRISNKLVTNGEYLQFIEEGGYTKFNFWLAEGWDWVKTNHVQAPEYWHNIEGEWFQYTLQGLQKIDLHAAVSHVSFYEATAYANWKKKRIPTEFEWEVAADRIHHGQRWEWTNSAYLPYPRFKLVEGPASEYNGKFMVNQMVLRGGSCATSPNHFRKTYRNFFHPHLKWQFTGIRLAETL